MSLRTLRLCMHETYEDCPFYEQLQYAMDSRAQILFTYTVAADDRLARKCMEDFRRSQRYDGLLNGSYPNYGSNVIPGFSIFYILMLYDHMMYFGDRDLLEEHFPTVERILRYFHTHLTAEGYVKKVGGLNGPDRFWSFIDWTPEWDETNGVPYVTLEGPITPFVQDVKRLTGRPIELMVSPWSPPAFMKTNADRNQGGKVRPECREFWAEYLCRYIAELRAEGLNVCRMSVQKEPVALQTWDSCIYSAQEEKEFLRDFLYPALQRAGLSDVEIFIWDHNKERAFERVCEIIDADTDPMIAGIAFHWYSGDHFETLAVIRERFPGKKLVFSEACIEYYKFDAGDYLANAQKYAHDMIGNFNAGMTAFYDWNLLLDQRGGPNHVHNYCDAPYMYNTETGELEARNTLAYIRHFSRYIRPGAVRIGMSRYTTDLEVAAFRNPDGRVAAVILNRTRNLSGAGKEENVVSHRDVTLTKYLFFVIFHSIREWNDTFF